MNEKDVWQQINALREAASYIKPKGDQEAILVLATQVERLEAQRKQLREALRESLDVMRDAARCLSDLPSTNKLGTVTRARWNDLNDTADSASAALKETE